MAKKKPVNASPARAAAPNDRQKARAVLSAVGQPGGSIDRYDQAELTELVAIYATDREGWGERFAPLWAKHRKRVAGKTPPAKRSAS